MIHRVGITMCTSVVLRIMGKSVLFLSQGKNITGASQFMVHFNIRSRYMGEIVGMKAAFQGNMDMLKQRLLENLSDAEDTNGKLNDKTIAMPAQNLFLMKSIRRCLVLFASI